MPIIRDAKGRIVKGSGAMNPGGRPKSLLTAVREVIGQDPTLIAGRMLRIWEGTEKGFGPRERMEAGKWLADRGYGKAPEIHAMMDAEQVAEILDVTPKDLRALARLDLPSQAPSLATIPPSHAAIPSEEEEDAQTD